MESANKKVYVDSKGLVTFICQDCGRAQKETAEAYKDAKGPVNIQCRCGNSYKVEIEFRKLYRKEVNLEGTYSSVYNSSNWGNIIVKDLSLQGCKFETLKTNSLNLYNEIEIKFYLKNAKNSLTKKRALIRYVSMNCVGCEFIELSNSIDPDLGFYLMKLQKIANARRFERISINQSENSRFQVIIERQVVNLVNISVDGIYVISKSPFPLRKVNISVNIKNHEKKELTGYVVRKENKGDKWGTAIHLFRHASEHMGKYENAGITSFNKERLTL